MRPFSRNQIERSRDTETPIDKGGGYGIQGIGVVLVERIDDSPSGVAGLPIHEAERSLCANGISAWAHWNTGSKARVS